MTFTAQPLQDVPIELVRRGHNHDRPPVYPGHTGRYGRPISIGDTQPSGRSGDVHNAWPDPSALAYRSESESEAVLDGPTFDGVVGWACRFQAGPDFGEVRRVEHPRACAA